MHSIDSTPFLNSQTIRITRRFYVIAAIAVLASLAGTIQNTIQFLGGAREWQFLLNYIIGIIGFFLSIISIWLVKRRRIPQAGWLLISYAVLNGIVATIVFTGIGLSMQAIITTAGILISFEMLPTRQRTFAVLVCVAAGLAAFGMDFLPPLWRVPTLSPIYNIVFVVVILSLFGIYLYLNFKYYNLHTRFLFVVLGINIFTVLLISFTANYLTSRIVSQNITTKVAVASSDLALDIDRFLINHLINAKVKANSRSLVSLLELSPNVRRNSFYESRTLHLFNEWLEQDPKYILSYAVVDLSGINILDTSTENIYKNESQFTYFSAPLETGLAYISPLLFTNNGEATFNISSPVRNTLHEVIGIFRIRCSSDSLNSIVAKYNARAGVNSFGVLLDEQGIILAHGQEPDLVTQPLRGLDENTVQLLHKEMRLAPIFRWLDFDELWTQLNLSQNPVVFENFSLSTINHEKAFVAGNRLNNTGWIISYFLPVSTALIPDQARTNTLILVAEVIAIIISILAVLASRIFTLPIYNLVYVADQYTRGNFSSRVNVNTQDEIGTLANTLNSMGEQLTNLLDGLEDQVQERTQGLEISAEIGRSLSTILNTSDLIQEVVTQLQTAFMYYHVHIYLMDQEHENLVMAGGTGEVGQILLDQNHTVPVGVGLVGRAAKTRNIVLVQNTFNDSGWLPNPYLPDTLSEIAIPIILSNQVLGVLDVQEKEVGKLGNEDAALLQLVAGQVAIGLRNARLVELIQKQASIQKRNRTAIEIIHRTIDLEQALKVAARELGKLTQASETLIKFKQ